MNPREFLESLHPAKLASHVNQNVVASFAIVGALFSLSYVVRPMHYLYRHFLRPRTNFKSRYGEGWALVTGASDGIGKAYALELAREGFNIALVARNQEKLDAAAQEIKATSKVETKTIMFDFNTWYNEETLEFLRSEIEAIGEIAILVNNVGAASADLIHKMKMPDIFKQLMVNIFPITVFTKLVVEKMLTREKRSAIINISSGGAVKYGPTLSVYCASKAYNMVFSEVISKEYQDKVDVLTVLCGSVKTNMNSGRYMFTI